MGYNAWFEPLQRRLLTLGMALAWLLLEVSTGTYGLWFFLAAAATVYCVWEYFLSGRYGNA